jgi:OOP family OmpA-OmpF porin
MKSILVTSIATLGVALAFPTFAQQTTSAADGTGLRMPYQSGFWGHAGLNLGRSHLHGSCPAGFSCDSRDTSWKAYVGGKFNNTFGLEVGLMDLGEFSRGGGNTTARGLDIALLAGVPVGQNSSIFAKLGTAYTRTNVGGVATPGFTTGHESGWGSRYGIGASIGIAQNWAVRLDADRYRVRFAGPRENIDTFTIGAQYSFK